MSFNKYILVILVGLSLSCKKLGEKRYVAPKVKLKVCLSDVNIKVKKYFNGNMRNEDIGMFFDCVTKTFNSFLSKYKEKEKNNYKPNDLVSFVQDKFYPDLSIPPKLIKEFMGFKKSLIGGSKLSFTKLEFIKVIGIIELLKKHTIKLNPYIGFYSTKISPEDISLSWLSLEAFNESLVALEESTQDISQEIGNNKSSYSFDDFEKLIVEIRLFLNWNTNFAKSKKTKDWIELIKSIKSVGLSGPEDKILSSQWGGVLTTSALLFSEYLRNHYFFRDKIPSSLISKNGLLQFESFSSNIVDYLNTSVDLHKRKRINFEEVDSLVKSLESLGFLPDKITSKNLSHSFKRIMTKVFGGHRKKKVDYFDKEMVTNFSNSLNGWIDLQKSINNQIRNTNKSSLTTMQVRDIGMSDLTNMRPLFSDKYEGVVLTYNNDSEFKKYGLNKKSFKNLSLFNIFKQVSVALNKGYSGSYNKTNKITGVTSDELQEFYLDFRPLGVDLGVVSPDEIAVGHRSFKEANFFMYSSNGIEFDFKIEGMNVVASEVTKMSVPETVELMSFLYSAGLHGNRIYDKLKDKEKFNCISARVDLSGDNYLKRDCVVKSFASMIKKDLGNLPHLQKDLLNYFSLNEFGKTTNEAEVINSLLTAINENNGKNVISRGSILSFYAVLQYIEAIMTRFDTNADGLLLEDELLDAFEQTYSSVMHTMAKPHEAEGSNPDLSYFYDDIKKRPKDFAKLEKEIENNTSWLEYIAYKWFLNEERDAKLYNEKLKSYFLYIIDTGQLPKDHQKHYYWWDKSNVFDVEIDRIQLIKSFSVMIGELSKINDSKKIDLEL